MVNRNVPVKNGYAGLEMSYVLSTRGSLIPAEQLDQLQEKAQKELVAVRQRLDETLNQEKRAMRCGLIKKRTELISDMVMMCID